jgi:phosphate/sulfate permease
MPSLFCLFIVKKYYFFFTVILRGLTLSATFARIVTTPLSTSASIVDGSIAFGSAVA